MGRFWPHEHPRHAVRDNSLTLHNCLAPSKLHALASFFRNFNLRLVLVCAMAIAISFPTGVVSTAKFLLLLGALGFLVTAILRGHKLKNTTAPHWTSAAILLALAGLALSMLWATAPIDEALHAWTKHTKLAMVPVIILLLRTRAEALRAMTCFLAMQAIILLLSWLSWLHLPMPFPTFATAERKYLVFAGQLDQPIMMALAAAVFWHLRKDIGLRSRNGFIASVGIVTLSLLSVLGIQYGRTGQVVAMATVAITIFWTVPRRYKILALLSPLVVAALAFAVSPQVQTRMGQVWQESNSYKASGDIESSSGERLNYWRRSLQAIAEQPVQGYGVGSWNMQYNRMEGGKGRIHTYQIRNPHEEFLLWTVEAGLFGLLLLAGIFIASFRDSLRMQSSAQRATFSTILAILIACAFNSALFDAAIGDFLCVCLGLCLAWGLRQGDGHPSRAV